MKKLTALFLVLAMCLGLIPAAFAESELSPAQFSCYIELDANIALEENKVLAWFEELSNTKFDFVVSTGAEMLSLLLNTGDYPEIITHNFGSSDIINYGVNEGIFVAIDPYIDEYMPNVKAYLDANPVFRQNITAPDGHIYGIPQLPASFAHGNAGRKIWINTAWLETLGLEMPQTTDELYDVLVAFRDRDPNGNGLKDEIPLSGCIGTWYGEPQYALMQSFVYCDTGNYMAVEDGKVTFVANTPEFREGLYYIKKLYDEGLLDPACFTQDLDQLSILGHNEGDVILGSYSCGHLAMAVDTSDLERSRMYDVMVTPASPSGRRVALYSDPQNTSGTYFAVTDICHDIPRALQTIDLMFAEETCVTFEYGIRGEYWDYAEEGMLDSDGNQALYAVLTTKANTDADNTAALRDNVWDPWRSFCDTSRTKYWIGNGDIYDGSAAGYEYRLYLASKAYEPYFPEETMPVIWADQDASEQNAQLRVIITDYVNQAMTRFITGDMNLDTEWDSYVQALENMDLATYVKYFEDGYAAAKAK